MDYLQRLWEFSKPAVIRQENFPRINVRGEKKPGIFFLAPNPDLPQFPRGTQVALLRRMIAIDADGELVPTGVVESLQIRVYREMQEPQTAFEFIMERVRLFRNESGGLRPVGMDERDFIPMLAPGVEPFQWTRSGDLTDFGTKFRTVVLKSCNDCHAADQAPGVLSVPTIVGSVEKSPGQLRFDVVKPDLGAGGSASWKRGQYTWGLLQGLWAAEAAPK